jgi:hypothetical protein
MSNFELNENTTLEIENDELKRLNKLLRSRYED